MPQKPAPSKPPILVIGIVVLVVIVGVAVYFAPKLFPGKTMMGLTGMGMPKVTEQDFAFIFDPLVRKHMVAQANQTSYRIKSTSSGKGGYTIMEFTMSSPEDIAYRTIDFNGTKEVSDMITVGDFTYLKDYSDNKWWKQGMNQPETDSEPEMTGEPEDTKDVETIADEYSKKEQSTFTNLGEEACGNLICHKFQEAMPDYPEATRTFWFDTKQYLLRKEENGFGEFLSTNEYEYDGVNVTAPSPTKDVPEGKSIYEYMMMDDSMMRDTKPGPDSADFQLDDQPNMEDVQKMIQDKMNQESTSDEYSE